MPAPTPSQSALWTLASLLPRRARSTKVTEVFTWLPPAVQRDIRLGAVTLDQTMGDLLTKDDAFARYFAGTMRKPARARFTKALTAWSARTKIPPPPPAWRGGPALSAQALLDFATDHHLERLLEHPLRALRPLTDADGWWPVSYLGDELIVDVLARGPSQTALKLVAEHLRSAFARPTEHAARQARIARGCASPQLEGFSARVQARLASLAFPEPPVAAPRPAEPKLDPDTLELVVVHVDSLTRRHIALSLLDHDADGALLSSDFPMQHPFVRALLERALDIAHDPQDPLHARLRALLEASRWERLLDRLGEATAEQAPARHGRRVAWRVEQRGGKLVIEALAQKRGRKGWTRGAVTAPDRLRDTADVDEHDERVLAALSRPPFDNRAETDWRARALHALAGHPRVRLGGSPCRVRVCAAELSVAESDDGEYALGLRVSDERIEPGEALAACIPGPALVRLRRDLGEVRVAALDPMLHQILSATAQLACSIPTPAGDRLMRVLTRLPETVGLELPPSLAGERVEPSRRLVVRLDPLPRAGLRARLFARPLPEGPRHPPGEGPIHLVGDRGGARVHTTRELGAERRAADELAAALGLDRAVHEDAFSYRFDELEDALGVLETLAERPELASAEWPEEPWKVGSLGWNKFAISLHGAGRWFEAHAELEVDERRVELARLLQALREGRRYVKLGKGAFARITDELRAELEPLAAVLHETRDGVRVGPEAVALLSAKLGPGQLLGDGAWTTLTERLRASAEATPEVPAGLSATLRDYQIEGVRWLLRTAGWAGGVCLADEMGLGKTVQTLALLLSRADEGPSLVVCPTSLADNWQRECARFAPDLNAIVYRGPNRKRGLSALGPGDLLIASYDVVARDAEALGALALSVLVLDEAQAIKNPMAQRTRAVRALSAETRVALSGTPIENRLSELWSLFSVLTPGLLGAWEGFRERFAVPIEVRGDAPRLAELRDLIRPFLLRRTKAQVARELPPRVEVVRPVDLSEEERALYEAERRSAVESLEGRQTDPDLRFHLLAMLTRLRRLVCDPALVFEDTGASSSKIQELLGLVEDLRREGHRALVFSQFTSLLTRVRQALDPRGVSYLYLDGKTPAATRAQLVDRWQGGSDPLFLISLKAGGTGLNLTAADYVIHLDPWWNPAVEDQASDRAHRIGQTKPVTVLRLVAQGTIEERVLEMHETKRRLASGLLEGAEANAAIDTEALIGLLADAERAPRP